MQSESIKADPKNELVRTVIDGQKKLIVEKDQKNHIGNSEKKVIKGFRQFLLYIDTNMGVQVFFPYTLNRILITYNSLSVFGVAL